MEIPNAELISEFRKLGTYVAKHDASLTDVPADQCDTDRNALQMAGENSTEK